MGDGKYWSGQKITEKRPTGAVPASVVPFEKLAGVIFAEAKQEVVVVWNGKNLQRERQPTAVPLNIRSIAACITSGIA